MHRKKHHHEYKLLEMLMLTERLLSSEPDALLLFSDTDVIIQQPPYAVYKTYKEKYDGKLVLGGEVRGGEGSVGGGGVFESLGDRGGPWSAPPPLLFTVVERDS
jgi:hypothetical protein